MVDFSISTIKIRNFRGAKNLKVDLPIDKLTSIIGQNNSGKSNLLEAVVLCLSPKEFSSYQIKDSDFWHDKNGMSAEFFDIELLFSTKTGSKLPVLRDNEGALVEVTGVKVSAEADSMEADQYLIDKNGERIFWGRKYATPHDIQQWLPEVWLLSPNTLEKDYEEWKSGYINKLFKSYKEEFLSNSAVEFIRVYKDLCEKGLKTQYWTTKIEPALKKDMSFFNGNIDRPTIKPGLKDLDEWLWEGLTVNIVPEDEWPLIGYEQLGKGWQSLLRLVALKSARQITEKNKKIMICIDEPEAYLTPFKQRKLQQYLNNLTKKACQIVMVTHSNQMINSQMNQRIIRLKMTKKGVEKHDFDGKAPKEILDNYSELIFGSGVVFDMTQKNDNLEQSIDWDTYESVLIKDKKMEEILSYVSFIRALGINWCFISDKDDEIAKMENEVSVYDKIVDIRKTEQKAEAVEDWLKNEWQGKEVLVLN